MARSMQEMALLCAPHQGSWVLYYYVMVVACQECAHRLCAEEVRVEDRFGVWVCFDEEEQSDTYAEQVGKCPECGAWLNTDALLGAHGWVRGR